MPKQITIEIPNWIDENYVMEIVKKIVEIEMQRRDVVERVLKKLELTEKDLEDFERFRDELWRKEAKRILLIVDSNILFSYFMLSRKIRNLMLNSRVTLYTPDWTIHELNKYFDNKIIKKKVEEKGISREEIELIVLDIMQRLIIVPKALYIDKWDEVMKIAEQFDVKDTPFIA